MIDELIQVVSTKTGLSLDQAKTAVDAVLGFLKTRLPAPLASGLDSLAGEGTSGVEGSGEGLANQASAALGNLFRKDS